MGPVPAPRGSPRPPGVDPTPGSRPARPSSASAWSPPGHGPALSSWAPFKALCTSHHPAPGGSTMSSGLCSHAAHAAPREHPSELPPVWEPLQAEEQELHGTPILQRGSPMPREAGLRPRQVSGVSSGQRWSPRVSSTGLVTGQGHVWELPSHHSPPALSLSAEIPAPCRAAPHRPTPAE